MPRRVAPQAMKTGPAPPGGSERGIHAASVDFVGPAKEISGMGQEAGEAE